MRPPHRAVPQTWTLQALSVVRPATHRVRRPLRHADHHAATKLLLSLTKGARGPATQDDDVFYLFLQKQNLGAKLHIYL